ncbi:MAG: glycosyltransferase, partial [Candidatus Yanofskybacteria bacterium]|nr:glycosyltransferase [Candidatus Yanofskybacteria bacterium]
LEAMACGLPILTCNEAYENILGKYRELLMYPKKDFETLADKIKHMIGLENAERGEVSSYLREIVVRDHNLEGLINKITRILFDSHE